MVRKLWLFASLLALLAACRAVAPITTAAPTQPVATPYSAALPSPTITRAAPALTPAASPTSASPAEPSPTETTAPLPSETPAHQEAASLPDPAGYAWQPVYAGLQFPLFIGGAGDGSDAVYIVQQSGQIRLARQGQVLDQPFLDISDRTSLPSAANYYGERGLLGLAFHPDYARNGYFYVNYTDRRGNTVIARFQRQAANPDLADPSSEQRLLQVNQPYPNHNGGMLAFGPDGDLYIGLGDGGSAGDPLNNAQSTDTLLGKLLRIDVDRGDPYAIPSGNPFAGGGEKPEIWAYGLRNPWRFTFDTLTHDLYIGDVGQANWEEIDYLPAGSPGGANFGWRYREGTHSYNGDPPAGANLTGPVAEYAHGPGCSVTGGVVARSPGLPAWQGVFLYGDYCSGQVWGLLRRADGSWQNELLFDSGLHISSFGQNDAGDVFVVDYAGSVYRLAAK